MSSPSRLTEKEPALLTSRATSPISRGAVQEPGHRASPLVSVAEALEELRAGRFVVLIDDEDRENEGDLVIAAQFVTPEAVNFMATHARGLICLCLTDERCEQLRLPPMAAANESPLDTAFTVSIEARDGVTTGISALDRARTSQVAVNPSQGPDDLVRPGHVFPLRARKGGVLQRAGHTEGAVDLARLAGLAPAGVICEIMNPDGTMARGEDLVAYCHQHELKMVRIADVIAHRRANEHLVARVAAARMPTDYGEFTAVAFNETLEARQHLAMVYGDVAGRTDVLVRVHSECLTGDVFLSRRCDCGEQLDMAMRRIVAEGRGVVLYLSQEGRGIGLVNKLRAYELQDHQGLDTVEANFALGFPADLREYGIGAQVLSDLGLSSIRVLTNNPKKVSGIEAFGIRVVEQVPIEAVPHAHNRNYLDTKRRRLGHRLGRTDVDVVEQVNLDGTLPSASRGIDSSRTLANHRKAQPCDSDF